MDRGRSRELSNLMSTDGRDAGFGDDFPKTKNTLLINRRRTDEIQFLETISQKHAYSKKAFLPTDGRNAIFESIRQKHAYSKMAFISTDGRNASFEDDSTKTRLLFT